MVVVIGMVGVTICARVHEWRTYAHLLKCSDKEPVSALLMAQIIPMYKVMINIQMLLLDVNIVACNFE